MKKMWKMRKDKSAVSPVIATILMVAITVVLAAVLYVMVMGFGGQTASQAPAVTLQKNGNTVTISITPQTAEGKIALKIGTATPMLLTTATASQVGATWTFGQTNDGFVTTGDTVTFSGTLPASIVFVYCPSSSVTATDLVVVGNTITF